jgi:hypothetical protein
VAKETILSVRLSASERKLIASAAKAEATALSSKLRGVLPTQFELSISAFVRAAALEKANGRMGKVAAKKSAARRA